MENKFVKGLEWDPNNLTPDMLNFEKTTGKNAVYRGKITGQFDYWLNWSKRSKNKPIQKQKIQKSKLRITTNKNIKKVKPRIVVQVPPESICYEKKRKGTNSNPIIESYSLNDVVIKYNWTKGQLYINNELLCPPDTKYGRDMLTYAKQNKPNISIDELRKWWIYNYDIAVKNNWEVYAVSIKKFLKSFGLVV